jgi:RHS repeat-associated protein
LRLHLHKSSRDFDPCNHAPAQHRLARTSSSGTTAWYLPDKLGSVRDIVSSSGSELDHVVYDSFGNILTETNASNGDRFKFAGMEYDALANQYYDRARYYDSSVGRFTRQDPMGFVAGDPDLYRFVCNDVTDDTDPSGYIGFMGPALRMAQALSNYFFPPEVSKPLPAVAVSPTKTRTVDTMNEAIIEGIKQKLRDPNITQADRAKLQNALNAYANVKFLGTNADNPDDNPPVKIVAAEYYKTAGIILVFNTFFGLDTNPGSFVRPQRLLHEIGHVVDSDFDEGDMPGDHPDNRVNNWAKDVFNLIKDTPPVKGLQGMPPELPPEGTE